MKKILILVTLFITLTFNSINAQTEISPEKQKALNELINLMAQDYNVEEMAQLTMMQINSTNLELIKASLKGKKDLNDTERASLEKKLVEETKKDILQFQNKLMQKINFNRLMREITLNLFNKFYSLEEINDLITFYKTPTGAKSLKIMKPLGIETVRLTNEVVIPKMVGAMEELREEQKLRITKMVDEMSPKKTKSNDK